MQLLPLPGLSSHHRKWHPAILLTSWPSGNFPQSRPVVGGPGRGLTLCSSSKAETITAVCGYSILPQIYLLITVSETVKLVVSLLHRFRDPDEKYLKESPKIFVEAKIFWTESVYIAGSCIPGAGGLSPSCVWCCWSIKFSRHTTTRPGRHRRNDRADRG